MVEQFVSKEKETGVENVSLDLLVNNAGIMPSEGMWDTQSETPEAVAAALLALDEEQWGKVFNINTSAIQASNSQYPFFPV